MHIEAEPKSEAARLALAVYADVLDAIRADRLVETFAHRKGGQLQLGADWFDLSGFERVLVAGAGKASASMAAAVATLLADRISGGIVVTKYGHAQPAGPITVLEAGHPIPDEASLAAGRAIHELILSAGARDLVIFLLSGGASSLMELPSPPVSLEDLRLTTELLLRAGAPIRELNAVRACLSQIKAGGLARAAAPARLVCLLLSDVLGNPLEVIGSGPCVDVVPDPERARDVLERFGVAGAVPATVHETLGGPPARRDSAPATHFVLGDIRTALATARESAVRQGLRPVVLTGWLEGEAREVGRVAGALARDMPSLAADPGVDCLILGGETTVTVVGQGSGGRSQELACAALGPLSDAAGVAVLAGSTDGTDGPTDAAGGLAEKAVAERAAEQGLDVNRALRENDTYRFLRAAGGLVKTGPTHSNVGDVVLIVSRAG